MYDHARDRAAQEAKAQGDRPSQRTIEQLLADLRNTDRRRDAVLALGPSVDPAALVGLFGEELMHDPTLAAKYFLATLQHVHHVGILGRDVVAGVNSDDMSKMLLKRLPHVMVSRWDPRSEGGEPVIPAVYRFAADPIAPRTQVRFTIAYLSSVDYTQNLVYDVSGIEEEEAQDPQGN